MVYRCLVVDNSEFFKIGKIRVRLFSETMPIEKIKDLSSDPKKRIDEYSNTFEDAEFAPCNITAGKVDVYATVTTPIGGANDYGLWYLPQPNTWGIVSNLYGYADGEYVWLGATYPVEPLSDRLNEVINYIGAPSDTDEENKSNLMKNGTINLEDKNSIILKTKSSEVVRDGEGNIDQEESSKKLNWSAKPMENIIIINGNEIIIKHVTNEETDDGTKRVNDATIKLKDSNLYLEVKDTEGKNNLSTSFDLQNMSIKNTVFATDDSNNTILNEIICDSDKTEISYVEASESSEKSNCNVLIGKRQSGYGDTTDSVISMTQAAGNGKYNEITMSKKTINIIAAEDVVLQPGNGGKVCIGDTDSPVLISPTGGDIKIGTVTIPTSKFLKA